MVLKILRLRTVLFTSVAFFQVSADSLEKNIAALSTNTGLATSFDPVSNNFANGSVYGLSFKNDTLYVFGDFSVIASQARNGLAAISLATGQLTSWNPNLNINAYVNSCIPENNILYIAGRFYNAGEAIRNNIAAIDMATGLATPWNPNINGSGSLNDVRSIKKKI